MREAPMIQAIAKRELMVLDGLGVRLQGTYHRPAGGLSVASGAGDRVGILFVNSLSLPRAAYSSVPATPVPTWKSEIWAATASSSSQYWKKSRLEAMTNPSKTTAQLALDQAR